MNLECKEQVDLLSNPKFHASVRDFIKQYGVIGLKTALDLQQACLPSQKELVRQQEEDDARKFAMKKATESTRDSIPGNTTERVKAAFEAHGGKNYHGLKSQIARELGICQVSVTYHLKKLGFR